MSNIDTNVKKNLFVIKASAGSGKTYRLAQEYIRLLLFKTADDGVTLIPRRPINSDALLNTHRQLLAITFTNKATDEMKSRIVKELHNLARDGKHSDYLQGFMERSGLPEPAVRQLARLALNELLFDYSNFNVSTIDSFFQTILRNFARELDRDFNYDIQIEEDYAVRVAVHNFLLSLGREGQPTPVDQWVKEYQRHLIRGDAEKKVWKFFDDNGDLTRFAKQINTELFRSHMDAIRVYLGQKDKEGRFQSDFSNIYAFQKFMHEIVKVFGDRINDSIARLKSALEVPSLEFFKGRSFDKFMAEGGTERLSATSWKEITDKKVKNQFRGQIPDDATVQTLVGLVKEHFLLRHLEEFFAHIENNLGLLGMLAMIDHFLEEYRHESNTILIGDTNELIGTVLDSGSDFVYERVGTAIAHFMIDEFQDTSTKQYENFHDLLEESLANSHFNMLIGDAKQSIYRFRNADITVFRDKVGNDFRHYIDDGRQATPDSNDPDQPTSTNYRSSPKVIEFNNRLFCFLRDRYAGRPTVQSTYADIVQAIPDGDKVPGYVRIVTNNFAAALSYPKIKATVAEEDLPDEGADFKNVLPILPGYLLKLHERYDWHSIGILVNSRADGQSIVETILAYNKRTSGEKIRIISGDSLLLNNSPVIRRIIAMLRFIDVSQFGGSEDSDETGDEDNKGKTDSFIRKRESDRRLYIALNAFIKAVASHPDDTPLNYGSLLANILSQESTTDESTPTDNTLEQILPPPGELTTLVSIVETIISHFKRDVAGTAEDVDREAAFLLAFQDTVMQFSSMRNGGSVREFLKFWDEKKDVLAVSSSAQDNAIEIMTIHKAKGLEFDCVVIPMAKWELDGNTQERSYWMTRDDFKSFARCVGIDSPKLEQEPDIVPPLLHINKKEAIAIYESGCLKDSPAAAFIRKQVDDTLIDNLNKTYVAMTRPRTELHIFAKGDTNSIATPLAEFAKAQMTPMQNADGWFDYGTQPTNEDFEELRKRKEEKKASQGEDDLHLITGEIQGYTVNDIPLKLKVKVENAVGTHISAGLRLHSLLSRIHDRNDLESVIAYGIKHGVISADPDDPCGVDSIRKHVYGPITAPKNRVASWFDPDNKVYSERTITTAANPSIWAPDGMENLRPDRIVRRPDGTILVIDYKSGERNDRKYCNQVKRYFDILRTIFPDAPVAGRIWYVTHDLILDHTGKEPNMNECD